VFSHFSRWRFLADSRTFNLIRKGETLAEKTLILGGGSDVMNIAKELLVKGAEVIVATPDPAVDAARFDDPGTGEKAAVEVIPITRCLACNGSVGRFDLVLDRKGDPVTCTVSSIILADEAVRTPNFSLYGLQASPAAVSLSQVREFLESGSGPAKSVSTAERTAFITGLAKESHPKITEEVMESALKLQQEFSRQTYILTGNLKVARDGLEALYREAKRAGCIFMKFTDAAPEIRQATDGRVTITFLDEITRERFRLVPDVTVVDDTLTLSDFMRDLAGRLGLDMGPDGFVQSDNVHRATVLTNRRGIFVAGHTRGIRMDTDRRTDAGNAALSVARLAGGRFAETVATAEIDTGQCVRCLTCFRVCPYGAVALNARLAVLSSACEGCGLCVAECPRGAIQIRPPVVGTAPEAPEPARDGFVPALTVFSCSRSAVPAKDLAACMGYKIPENWQMVAVPCAGGVSVEHLLTAFQKGADGVLVLTCHVGNCHSQHGNLYARQRVDHIRDVLAVMGLEPERLMWRSLASNMGGEFAEILGTFEEKIRELGPSRLKNG